MLFRGPLHFRLECFSVNSGAGLSPSLLLRATQHSAATASKTRSYQAQLKESVLLYRDIRLEACLDFREHQFLFK
jgi:hypothetical protein